MSQINFDENVLSLEKVLDSAREYVENLEEAKEDKMKAFSRIAAGVARKYASKYVDREDLEQELWVKILELIRDSGGEENLDERFVARSCYNYAVDFYRYGRRRTESKAIFDESWEEHIDRCGDRVEINTSIRQSRIIDGPEQVMIKEVLDLFPLGSRERQYVVAKLYFYGEIDETSGIPDKLEIPEGESEIDFLRLLGYKSHSPASWNRKKYDIRKKIYQYFGTVDSTAAGQSTASRSAEILKIVEGVFLGSRSGYINLDKLLKMFPLKVLEVTLEDLREVGRQSQKLLRGISIYDEEFLMKWEDRYLENSEKNHDKIFYEGKEKKEDK